MLIIGGAAIGALLLVAILIVLIVILTTQPSNGVVLTPDSLSLNAEAEHYIVVLKDQENCPRAKTEDCCKTHKCEHSHIFEHGLKGFSAHLTGKQLQALRKDPQVHHIERDMIVSLPKPVENISALSTPQTTGWNITREGGIYKGSISPNIQIFVVDTGRPNHPDLKIASSVSFVSSSPSGVDKNGHASHVSGIIAAMNNSIDVVGVAPGIAINTVQVLDSSGSGTLTSVINGINYVIQQKKTKYAKQAVVMNLSLGMNTGTTAYNAMDNAVQAAINAGVIVCIAAGNSAIDCRYSSPSHVTSAIVVGSYGSSNKFSYFSNYGPGVTILSPGEQILSTYLNGANTILNGTSMSCPGCVGWVALYLSQPGNLLKTPAEVKAALQAIATSSSNPAITGAPAGTTNKSVYINFAPAPTPSTPSYLHSACSYCRHSV